MAKLPGVPVILRVHRTLVDGETVDIRLEPFRPQDTLHPAEGDEFITGVLMTDPWAESAAG